MGLQKIGKKIKKQTAQAVQKAQSTAKPSQTPKRTGAAAVAKKTGQAAGQKVQYYSNKNKGGARRTGTAVKNKVGAKVKANKNTPTPYQRQKMAQANVKMRQLNIPTGTKDYFKNPQKNPLDRRDLLSQIGGALQAAQNPADRFHGLKERSVTRSPMEQLRADAMAGRGAWASDLRVETKKSDKDKAKEIVENSKRYFRNKKIARQDLSEWDRRNMNAAQQRQVQEAKLRYKEAQKAGKKEDAARAHREAENLRGLHGYSGGAAGDQFIRPELSQGEYNALNSQGELAMRQARMARQRAVTEDEIARADQRIEAILRAPGYREGPATDADTSRGWSFGPEGRRMWAGTREQNRQDAAPDIAALKSLGYGWAGQAASFAETTVDANQDMRSRNNMEQWFRDADDYISAKNDLEYYDNFVKQFGRKPDDMPNRNVLVMRLNNAIQARAQIRRMQTDPRSIYYDPAIAAVQGTVDTDAYKIPGRDDLKTPMETLYQAGERPDWDNPEPTTGDRLLQRRDELQAEALAGKTGLEQKLTELALSLGDSAPKMALSVIPGVGPGLTAASFGVGAAGEKSYELKQRGVPAEERYWRGLLSGGIEAGTNVFPVGHFAETVLGKTGNTALKNMGVQSLEEALQEGASYALNVGADKLARDPEARFSLAELAENMLMGAASGAAFGAVGSFIGEGRNRAAMPQVDAIQAKTTEQAAIVTQVQDIVSDERTQEARSLLEDTKAYNEMKQTGLYSQDELGMMRDALNERYARLAGVEEVPQTVTEPAPRTLEEAAQQRTMNVQPEMPHVQWERSKFPPSSLVGSLIDAARENNARNRAAEQLRADQAAFRAQQAQREAQAAQTKAQPVQTQTAERQAQPVGQARSMAQQSPQVQRDILARNVSAFGENGRKAIMEAYQGGDAGTYRQAFAQVYDQALSGKTQEQITRPRALTEPQFYAAVQSGMNDRAAARPVGRVAGRNKNAGVDWRDQYVRQMDRKTVKMVDGVARALGVRVIFADEGSILTGTGAQANAEIVGNVVRIEKNNPSPVRKLIGHELTHRMQDLSPETYQTFRDYVMSIPGAQNALEQTLALYDSGTGGFTREAAMDELAADFAGELWDSSEKLQDFIRKNYTNRKLLERVRDAFRALAAKLTGREKVQADEAVRLLEDALGAASEAVKTMETGTSRTEKGVKRFSLSSPVEETDRFIASHNLNAEKMRGALELGGLAMPSVAMTPANIAHTGYGDITVVFGKDSVNPKDKHNQIFSDDAYTPTVPAAGYKISSDVTKRLRERIDTLLDGQPSDLRSKVALDTDNIRDNIQRWGEDFGKVYGDNIALKTAYLIDQGENIKAPMRYAATSSGMDKATIRKAIRMFGDMDKLNSADKLDAFIEPARELERQYYREKFSKKPELADTLVENFGWSDVDKLRNDAQYLKRHGDLRKITDLDALEKTVSRKMGTKKKQAAFEDWLRRESEGIIEKKGIRNDKDIFTRTGNRRSFEQLYDDYNLANIVKAMQQDVKQGKVGFLTGSGNIRGAAAKTYGSIEDARKEIGRIWETGKDEDFTAQYKAFDQRCRDLCAEMTEGTRLAAWDAAEALTETLAKHKTEPAIYRYLMKEWGSDGYLNITPDIAQEAAELIKEAQKLPIHYMEAKLYRAVDLTEPLAYVVPSNLDKDLKQQMKDAGLPMKTYKAGDREDRLNKVNAVKGARFSISARTDADYMAAVETGDMETAQRMVDEAAKAAGYERFGDFFVDKSLDLETPSPTTRQKQMFEAGKKYGDSDSGFNQFFDEDPDLAEYYVYNSNLQRWYYAGARDEMPEYRLAIRYGDIPEEGRSRNWATGELERGVSAVDFLTDKTQGKQTIYDAIYGIQDTTKNIIGGWDFGIFGSDGEPLLVGAKNIVPFTEVSKLKLADPVTYDDDGNVVPLSERFQDDNPDIRHSLAGTGGLDSARLLRENQKLRDRVEYWKGQTKKSDRAKVEPKEVKKLARRLATDFSSAMDRTEIAGELQTIYDGLGRDWTYDQAYEAAHALAMNMVEQASESDGFLYNEYEPLRMFFRETPLVISPEIRRGITDYNDWRKAQMGRLRLQSGEQSNIDQVYQEVSQLWPEWFDEEREVTSLDQLERIVEVMDGIYTQEETNPFQDDLEGPAGYLAAEIMDSFWDLPNVKKTWADRAEARLGREVTRRLDMQEKYQEKLRQVREDRDRKLKEQSAAYLGKTKARSQRQKERERRAQIMRHARDLSKKLLKPSDKQHIPQQLREAVAAVLDSVNLASKNFKETNRTKAFQELRLAYRDILKQGESLVIDPDLMDNISEVEAMRDTPIAEMDLSQLETIWRTIRAVEASITTANKAFGQQRFATIFEAADGLRQGLGSRKDRGTYRFGVKELDRLLNSTMLTPESYFHRMGQTGQDIFRMLRNAQDKHIGIMQEAQDHTEKIVGKTKVRKWEKEVHTFDFDGEKVQLTTAQIMSLYELLKRQQAVDHITVGGFRPEMLTKGLKEYAPSAPYRLTIDQISEIVDSLTDEQMEMADALQKYMGGRLAQLGNEASMAVYGYEKFNEKNYFPIKVDKNQTVTDQTKEAQAATIADRGFTKSTTPKANNALIVRNIFDVYADHVTDMATYSSWLEAMENLQRIYNFTFRDTEGNRTGTVKANLERAFGKNGLSYWEKLTEDLNNGVHGTNDNPFNSLIGNYKASAIGANIRVFIQQPTAILRALDDINPADFLAGLGRARPTTWAKVKKYAPIAVWKDWGYFDADTGRQMKSILFGDDSALAKVNNSLMAPAGAMDSLAWSHIWNALEAETRRTRKDLKPRTDEFYQAVAARFNAIIDHSQVVDGILQRSQVMRSPDALTKMATSFMAEPTKVYNMFTTAVYDLKHSQDPKARTQAMKVMGRTTFALIASFFANAAAQSLVDALRDDDKDEDYWEKFFQAFYGLEGDEETTGAKIKNGILEGNLGAAFNPATYIPWMKDVVSLAQGFKVSRMDMDSISKFVQEIGSTWKAFHGDGKITLQNALTRLTAEGARLLGIPASNIKRDVLAIYSTAMNSQNNYLGQFELQKWLYRLDNSNNWTDFVKIAYAAQQAGDTTAYEKIKAELVDAMGQEKFDTKMKNLAKKAMETVGEQEEAFAGIYGTYETQMAGNPLYNEMPAEQRAKVEASLKQYAGDQVMKDASNGEITSADTEMAAIKEAEDAGIDPVTYKCFRVYYNGLASDKDANGEDIPGQTKQDKTIQAIEELELGKEKSSYLYHTCYSSDKNNPWA